MTYDLPNTTHCCVSQLGVRGHLELLVNKSIEKPLPHTSGYTSIDSEGELGPGHISLWGEGTCLYTNEDIQFSLLVPC